MMWRSLSLFFFFNDTATTEIYTLSLHDALPIYQARLQIANSQIGLEGTRNATRPQLDLVGVMQNNGLAGQASPFTAYQDPGFVGGYGSVLDQILTRKYPTYGIGLQMTL